MRFLLSILLVTFCLSEGLHAHSTLMIGGQASFSTEGDAVLRLQVTPNQMATLMQSDANPKAVNQPQGLDKILTRSLSLRIGDRILAPSEVTIPAMQDPSSLQNGTRPPDATEVVARWHDLPAGTSKVNKHLSLDNGNFILVLTKEEQIASIPSAPANSTPTVTTTALPEPLLQTMLRSLMVGIEHIIPNGLDHILFILGLYGASRRVRDLLTQVTAFTVAHCLTLGLAMGGVIVLGPAWSRAVEVGIALSIVAVAIENCRRPASPGWGRLSLIGGLGLIHGLAFSGALSEVAWPAGRFLPSLLSANIGIEIGQLLVIGAAGLVTGWWWSRPWYYRRVAVPLSCCIGVCGLVWTIQRIETSLLAII